MKLRAVFAIMLALVFATGAYAFTALNTIPKSYAGEGNGTVAGYTVSDITYTLSSLPEPVFVTAVEFNLDQPATTVKATLDNDLDVDTTCLYTGTVGPLFHWVCTAVPGNQMPLEHIVGLAVYAAQ